MPDSMTDEHFGSCLRRAREDRALSLGDVSASTKVPRSSLELLEAGSLAGLPALVFVRGFIRSYAKAVGIAETRPLSLFDHAVKAQTDAARAASANPIVDPVLAGRQVDVGAGPVPPRALAQESEEEEPGRRRGLGLAVFVIILVLIATITLSLLLRRPPQSGEGLSLSPAGPGASPATLALGEVSSRQG
jgi:hypothetical protein